MPIRKIELSNMKNVFFTISECDYARVNQHKWNYDRQKRCIYASIGGVRTYLTRYILGTTDPKIQIDHKNHNRFYNNRENLRECTQQQNLMNKDKNNGNSSSGFIGVIWYEPLQKWRARISVNGKKIHIGYFDSEIAAARAYDEAAKCYHGEFASLNFP